MYIIRRENRSRKMASDETMEAYGSDEESLAFSQLHTPLTQNPSKSPLDVSYVIKISVGVLVSRSLFLAYIAHSVHVHISVFCIVVQLNILLLHCPSPNYIC